MWTLQLLAVLLTVSLALAGGPKLDLPAIVAMIQESLPVGSRSGRALGGLAGLVGRSKLIVTPKLEITSPTFPPDGGSFILYADIPINLGGVSGTAGMFAANRNFSSPDPAPVAAPGFAADALGDDPAGGDGETLRHPILVTSYGRGSRAEDEGLGGGLSTAAGLHDVATELLLRLGVDGRACLLRGVCELAARPLRNNGLLGDLINAAVEIPSTNSPALEKELSVARGLGQRQAPCAEVFTNCDNSFFAQIAK